jgi:hypothetical protein
MAIAVAFQCFACANAPTSYRYEPKRVARLQLTRTVVHLDTSQAPEVLFDSRRPVRRLSSVSALFLTSLG